MAEVEASRHKGRSRTGQVGAVALAAASIGLWAATGCPARAAGLPAPDHVVVVVMENHGYVQVIGSSDAPYINHTLKAGGADLTRSFALTHPSEPNYYMLFSGSDQGRAKDRCTGVGSLTAPNLAAELITAGKTWASYNESLPRQGSTVCGSGYYTQRHTPWFGFSNVPAGTAKTMAQFPAHFTELPKVSFVVPNLCDDMHTCPVSTGDTWIKNKLGPYADWARTHNSLLVLTFDEGSKGSGNRIPTLLYGEHVVPGSSSNATYDHYDVLRTLEDLAGLTTHAGRAASASDITGIWK
ncbi:alkaline phosphatase family protein [Streptomyces sp. NBC_01618]|uniref:alkaline phosphatase family protein n=1 Tax=Streptomyces sp. NBC_01618 TaxID=2975900 RepID=UPI00386BD9E3|nr:alkaline phosphatase family protein [Streptomyces sp. NBC_01618]